MKVKLYNPKFIILLAFGICIVCTLVMLPFLPNDLPMQFDSSGEVNWYAPKWLGVCFIPSIALFITGYTLKADKLNFSSAASILLILVLDIGFLGYIVFFR